MFDREGSRFTVAGLVAAPDNTVSREMSSTKAPPPQKPPGWVRNYFLLES